MTKPSRTSIYLQGAQHRNPIPNACVLGSLFMSSLINGADPQTGDLPPALEEQCVLMFENVRRLLEAAGGGLHHVVKMTVWLRDADDRDALNKVWQGTFPDAADRPARHTLEGRMREGILVQCEVTAVLG